VHRDYPDVLFLAEAFTRPKRMKLLGKVGFTQSYSYFTWRNSRYELEQYAHELFGTDDRLFMRPNFFANTPDILHEYLQKGGRPALPHPARAGGHALAQLRHLLGLRAVREPPAARGQRGVPRLGEVPAQGLGLAAAGQHHPRGRTPSIRCGHEHPALQLADNLRILGSNCPQMMAYAKATPALDDVLVMIVNMDPYQPHDATIRVPTELYGGGEKDGYGVVDLLTGERYTWYGPHNYVRLEPHKMPAHVLRIERLG